MKMISNIFSKSNTSPFYFENLFRLCLIFENIKKKNIVKEKYFFIFDCVMKNAKKCQI